MANWPTTLPQCLNADTYNEVIDSGFIRTSMDAGPDFVRRRFSAVTTKVNGQQFLTETEWATLMNFYNTTLGGGVASFNWHPAGLHEGSPQVVYDMRFLSPPARRPLAGRYLWAVDMAFEILP